MNGLLLIPSSADWKIAIEDIYAILYWMRGCLKVRRLLKKFTASRLAYCRFLPIYFFSAKIVNFFCFFALCNDRRLAIIAERNLLAHNQMSVETECILKIPVGYRPKAPAPVNIEFQLQQEAIIDRSFLVSNDWPIFLFYLIINSKSQSGNHTKLCEHKQ